MGLWWKARVYQIPWPLGVSAFFMAYRLHKTPHNKALEMYAATVTGNLSGNALH